MGVVYFDQCLGAAQSKRWSKSKFLLSKSKKEELRHFSLLEFDQIRHYKILLHYISPTVPFTRGEKTYTFNVYLVL